MNVCGKAATRKQAQKTLWKSTNIKVLKVRYQQIKMNFEQQKKKLGDDGPAAALK